MALDVLKCTNCSAPIPFGDDATTTCPFCKTSNAVPANYREMREAKALDATSRADAERVLRTLDRPPWLVTKIIARLLDLPMLAFWLIYGVPVGIYSILHGISVADRLAHRFLSVPAKQEAPWWLSVTSVFTILFVIIFVPRVIGIFANRRISDRMRLIAALAAKPPRTPGGPAGCRNCGAPLMVETDGLLARCPYCNTDNAVQLRTKIVLAVAKSARRVSSTMREVAAGDRLNRKRTRALLGKELFRYAWPMAAFAVLTIVGGSTNKTLSGIATATSALFLIGLMLYSLVRLGAKNDREERTAGNDVPVWVGYVGPLGVLFLMWFYAAHC